MIMRRSCHAKILLEAIEKVVSHALTGVRHALGKLQGQPLAHREERIIAPVPEHRFDLFAHSPVLLAPVALLSIQYGQPLI